MLFYVVSAALFGCAYSLSLPKLGAAFPVEFKNLNELSSAMGNLSAEHIANATQGMHEVLNHWGQFLEAVSQKNSSNNSTKPVAGKRTIGDGGKTLRWFNNDNYNNQPKEAPKEEEVHENKYYSLQGYYARYGSAGVEKNKHLRSTTTKSVDVPTNDQAQVALAAESGFEEKKFDAPVL